MSAVSNRRIGVILAAGRGRRMGRTKQLVPWPTPAGKVPLVAVSYDAIHPICDDMVVVLGHAADAVAAALEDRRFARVLSDPDAPMFESIRDGLRAASGIDSNASIVLHPGDHPEVAQSTLDALLDGSIQRSTQAIIPEYDKHGGHPILIPPTIATMLVDVDCPNGLGEFWTTHPDLCMRIRVDDAAVVRDIDLPADVGE